MKKLALSLVLTFFTLLGVYAQETAENIYIIIDSNLTKYTINKPIEYNIIINEELYTKINANTCLKVLAPIGEFVSIRIVADYKDVEIKSGDHSYKYIGDNSKEVYSTSLKVRDNKGICIMKIIHNSLYIFEENDGMYHANVTFRYLIPELKEKDKSYRKAIYRIMADINEGKYAIKNVKLNIKKL